MAKRRRAAEAPPHGTAAAGAASAPQPARDGGAVAILALAIFLAPAVGVPHEHMLQDTLKSMVASFGALLAALAFLLAQRGRDQPLRWHGLLWLPLLLMAHALGSMAWSHAYLGGVEAIRWFVFALIAWLGLNTFTRERLPLLAWALLAGALVASVWTAAQFWFDARLFPQGPNPASTFINRNFFAEFVVCALPFGALLLARARQAALVALLSVALGFLATALLMTGTRSALVSLWLQVLVLWPLVAWRCRAALAWPAWPKWLKLGAPALAAATVLALGAIPSGNAKILEEGHGATPIERGLRRTGSTVKAGADDGAVSLRIVMWKDTLRAIRARPLAGLGAGAWESEIPLYQAQGSQLETDYYVHNEVLQLLAEYGLAGWIFLLLLFTYLLQAFWRSWRGVGTEADAERPWRATALCSLFVLLLVSNAGFPWRLAATGALFALCLGVLAASDVRLGFVGRAQALPLRWSPRIAHAGIAASVACLALAAFISTRAVQAEARLVGAAKLAVSITATGQPNHPRFDAAKQQMLQQVREGIAINPHYRKVTPMVADELARWGDWANALWIWESVLASRPHIVAIMSNAARGHATLGNNDQAFALLERAKRIQPEAPTVRSLEVILLARTGQEKRAMQVAQEAVASGVVDQDLVNTYMVLAWRAGDLDLARRLVQRRMQLWPETRARSLVQLGMIERANPAVALRYIREGLAAAKPGEREGLLRQVPPELRARLDDAAP